MPMGLVVGGIALVLVLCCTCGGLVVGYQLGGGDLTKSFQPLTSAFNRATPTPDRTSPVSLRTKGIMDNGLEMIVTVQRPLKIEGTVKIPPTDQFMLVSVTMTNTKKTDIKVSAADFKVKGDGGLTYDANPPKTVTMPNMLVEATIAPGKKLDAELIYQIAANDSGLKLIYLKRTFLLEEQK